MSLLAPTALLWLTPALKYFAGYLESYVKRQVREPLTNYGPIGLIWFDTPKGISLEQGQDLVDFVHTI